jgi:hypothetical protein
MLCFFISLIDFDWIKVHLISGQVGSDRVRIGSDQFDFLKKLDRIEFGSDSDPNKSGEFLGSDQILPPLHTLHISVPIRTNPRFNVNNEKYELF